MAAMQPASQRLRAAEDIPEEADVSEAAPTPIQPRAAKGPGPMGYDDFPAMVHATDPEGWLIGVSDHWLAVMGYGREEGLGRHCTEFLTEESRHHALETVIPTVMRTDLCRDVACQFVDGIKAAAVFLAEQQFKLFPLVQNHFRKEIGEQDGNCLAVVSVRRIAHQARAGIAPMANDVHGELQTIQVFTRDFATNR